MLKVMYVKIKKKQWQKLNNVTNKQLSDATKEIESSPRFSCIGKNLYKKRIAGNSSGKRSGYRILIAAKVNANYFFLYGFPKNEIDNIGSKELLLLKELAKIYTALTEIELKYAVENKELEIMIEEITNE